MELRHLRYFLAVHEHRNFTRASETLNVSQPTLSQQIRDMEEELGCLLFHREYHQLIPTDAGELTRRYAREVLSTVDELTHNIQELQGMRHGCLRLGVIQTFNAYYLPDILGSFARDKPSINIEVEELANGDISEAVLSGRLHMGIGFTASDRRLHTRKLYDEDILIACSPGHRLCGRSHVKVSALANETLLTLPRRFTLRQWVDELMAKHQVTPKRTIELSTIPAILGALQSIDGVAILPAATQRNRPGTNAHFVKLTPALPIRGISIHRLPSSNSIPLVRSFEQHLVKSFQER